MRNGTDQTNQVKAIGLRERRARTVTKPASMPTSEPLEFAANQRFREEQAQQAAKGQGRNRQASFEHGPQCTNPKTMSAAPHSSVMRLDSFKSLAGSLLFLLARKLEKSRVLLAAREFNAPLAFDMATAMMDGKKQSRKAGWHLLDQEDR